MERFRISYIRNEDFVSLNVAIKNLASLRSLTSRSVMTESILMRMVGSIEILSSIEDFLKPVFSSDLVHNVI